MRKLVVLAVLAVIGQVVVSAAPGAALSPDIVISQVYGGGGNPGSTYTNDFVELFNRGTSPVSLAGWSVQYAASSGSIWSSTPVSGTLQPGQYYLIQQGAGPGGTTSLPTPDAIGTIAMSAVAGKVALVGSTVALTGACPTGGAIVDFVGYGSSDCFEGSGPAPVLTNTTAALRKNGGATDTNDNSADFVARAPNPRNSTSVADLAPSVVMTTPTAGAVDVAVDANITIVFDEPVSVVGAWFSITCTTSGAHTATVTGGPTSYSLDPDVDFAPGESCTIVVFASQVADLDTIDPPDSMATDFVSTFATVANQPPSVELPVTVPSPSTPGQAVTASARFSDDTSVGSFSCTVDYGAGDGPQAGLITDNRCTGPIHVYTRIGTYRVTVAVTDPQLATGSNTINHTVSFAFEGFLAPIANPPTVNQTKAGQSIPIQFRLGGDQGLAVFAPGFPKSQPLACDDTAALGEVETISTPGASGLTYDPTTGIYTYVWKTNKQWSGTCRILILRLADGTERHATFRFR